MALNRREFLTLGAGLGFGSLSFSKPGHAATNSQLLQQFPRLIAQNIPINASILGRHSGFLVQSDYGTFSNNFEA
ncbi:MAG: hypothetical protein F6K11_25070, partial [Leptolyngbya sp. SIO3F4]|nr:hypothetical protein [Leptolyngbya sp. SIO3F4]